MLYLDGTDIQTCPACFRQWLDLEGIREPVTDGDEMRADDGDEEGEGCLLCGGEW